jgi:hypothetical protein
MMLWTTVLIGMVLAALLLSKAFGKNVWGSLALTPDYVAGGIAGVGFGLALCPVLIVWLGLEPRQLSLPGVAIACVGSSVALYVQKRIARRRLAAN